MRCEVAVKEPTLVPLGTAPIAPSVILLKLSVLFAQWLHPAHVLSSGSLQGL